MSDEAFIARFLPRFPEWKERPGAVDEAGLVEIAKDLGLGCRVETVRDYEGVLQAHRAGRGILVQTRRAPEQVDPALAMQDYVLLLVDMTKDDFEVWCPYRSGLSDVLPRASRVWWERWGASGLVLCPAAAVS